MIHTQVEQKRGCGFRKPGKNGVGIYLMSGVLSAPCGLLPFPLHVCPVCGHGIKRARGWTWIEPQQLFSTLPTSCHDTEAQRAASLFHSLFERPSCGLCPVGSRPAGKHGLVWIGEKFYPTPLSFAREAAQMGVSRKVAALPRGFELGQTWIYLGHGRAVLDPSAITVPVEQSANDSGDQGALFAAEKPPSEREQLGKMLPGIFTAFRPKSIDLVVDVDKEEDLPEAAKKLKERFGDDARYVRVIRDEDAQTGLFEDDDEDEEEPW